MRDRRSRTICGRFLRMLPAGPNSARCLILACGNTLRSDDGVGPWLAAWAEERFQANPAIRIISRQQWTPDLAEELAHADGVIFIDCALCTAPGAVRIAPVQPLPAQAGLITHHLGAAELLALSEELYDSLPRSALLLTIGAGSTDVGETFSQPVLSSLPPACQLLDNTVRGLLGPSQAVDPSHPT